MTPAETARAVVDACTHFSTQLGVACLYCIAAAIQAERERCATEVERDRTWGADAVYIQRELAAAIRRG